MQFFNLIVSMPNWSVCHRKGHYTLHITH